MEALPTQECQRTRSYLSHESNHPSTAIPEQQRSLAWRHSTRATCRSRTEVELGLEAPRCLQYQIYRVCRCRRPRSTRRRIDTSRCMEAWVGSRCSNSRGYAYQDMHVHQLHVEVITLSQFHICMSHVKSGRPPLPRDHIVIAQTVSYCIGMSHDRHQLSVERPPTAPMPRRGKRIQVGSKTVWGC